MPDRSQYRTEEDKILIEEAKYNPNRELAIALGERLDDVILNMESDIYDAKERANDFERDANQLDLKIEELENKIVVLELMLSDRERIIEELKKGN